jgi:predicted DNA-binding transcriptional regulator AlpA
MYSKQPEASYSPNIVPDQTVQTDGENGSWMLLPEASEATGLSEKTLRRYIKKKTVKSRRLGKSVNSPLQVWITPSTAKDVQEDHGSAEEVVDVFDADHDEIEGQVENFSPESNEPVSGGGADAAGVQVDRIVRAIAEQFAAKLDEHKELIFELRNELHDKERQLRLLPDMQKKLEETEKMSSFENQALQKQIEELKLEAERLRSEAEAAKQQLQQAKQPKTSWLSRLFGGGKSEPTDPSA